MTSLTQDIDHFAIAVGDLDRAVDIFSRLGFTLTARSQHSGQVTPQGPVEPWGSANQCAMMETGYLELIGVTDASLFSNAKVMIEKYEGIHIVAFRPQSVDAVYEIHRREQLPLEEPRSLTRMVSYGPAGDSSREVAFKNMYLNREYLPEARFLFTEHLTRETMWQAHLLKHQNTAKGIVGLWMCSECPDQLAEKLASMLQLSFSATPIGRMTQMVTSSLHITTPAAWEKAFGITLTVPTPSPVAVSILVDSLRVLHDTAAQNGLVLHEAMGGLCLLPADGFGATVHFCESLSLG